MAIAATVAGALLSSGQASAAAKPNVIVITSDDIGYNELGFSSALTGIGTQFETPNLDALAQQSVVARQSYSAHSLCSPSRAGLLLGQYQHRIGLQDNLGESINDTQYGIPANTKLMPRYMKDLGYTTGMVGKWHIGYADGVNRPGDMGFDQSYAVIGSGRNYFSDFNPAHGIWKNNQFYESQYATEGDHAKYDPVFGRYATDAFGEEAASFINQHANDANPFFLYAPFTASHTPFGVKQSDHDHFAHITNPTTRALAAMTYAFDRAVGEIVAAVNNNGLANNTIIVYVNDNGGNNYNDNRPFRGIKGGAYEGSVRMPSFIKMPGVTPGVYDKPIVTYDLLPTFYAAAGGDVSQIPTDGVDLKPYLTGQNTAAPHETLFWRNVIQFAVRKGDWKMGNMGGGEFALYNIANDPGETTNLANVNPGKYSELFYDYSRWEASLGKSMPGGQPVNAFDHFVLRTDINDNWNSANRWLQGGTANQATLFPADSYANLILEFPVKNGSNYSAFNNRLRQILQFIFANQLRFTGNFTDTTTRSGTIFGNGLFMVKSLSGQLPQLQLDATSSGTPAKFGFAINTDFYLQDDLEITGNGTQDFIIGGKISDYTPGSNVTKTGTSTVTLTAANTFTGFLRVSQGQVRLSGANAGLVANAIVVDSAGTFSQLGGTVATHTVNVAPGGSFQFNAGELRVTNFVGHLTNQGGNFSPGASPAASTVSGNLVQTAPSTKLTMELAGTTPGTGYDQLTVGGAAQIGGTLQIALLPGFLQQTGSIYTLIDTASGLSGTFANTIFPALSGGRSWRLIYNPTSLQLTIDPTGGWNGIAGDFDRNGKVDAADYVVWRNDLNSTTRLLADADGDGTVEMDDYQAWRANFGNTAPGSGSNLTGVPEPGTFLLALLATLGATERLRRRARVALSL